MVRGEGKGQEVGGEQGSRLAAFRRVSDVG